MASGPAGTGAAGPHRHQPVRSLPLPTRHSAFIPPHLLAALAESPDLTPPATRRRTATLLLTDVSGFTRLTERLQQAGRQGAEEIARLVESVLAPAVDAAARNGGSIVGFGGDAVLALFEGAGAVERARRTASAIGPARTAVTSTGRRLRLAFTHAIHRGPFDEIHLGRDDRRHYLVGGPAVRALARMEEQGEAGATILSRAARRRSHSPVSTRTGDRRRRVPERLVRAYLPHALGQVVGELPGEYRHTAILFLETRPFSVKLLQPFFLDLGEVLDTFGGILLKTDIAATGTRWLCAFGIVASHEHDVENAARAAAELRARHPAGLSLRAGIHSGTVAVLEIGTPSRRSLDVMGDAVNTAARAMAAAPWGTVAITRAVAREVPSAATRALGRQRVKGKARPLELHALHHVGSGTRRVQVRASLVGRAPVLDRCSAALHVARRGNGAALLVLGEAGLGKSRLKWEVARLARRRGFDVHEGSSISHGGAPYQAIAGLVRATLGLPPDAAPTRVDRSLERAARRHRLAASDVHHLRDVLGLDIGAASARELGRDARLRGNERALRHWIGAIAATRPQLLVVEDLHWADELSIAAVSSVARSLEHHPVFLLLLARPTVSDLGPIATETLTPISREETAHMLRQLLPDAAGPLIRLVQERSEGNPLYVEELVRHVTEIGAGGSEALDRLGRETPERLATLLATRLGALPIRARQTLQLAAVIGRRFTRDLLQQLSNAAVEQPLASLIDREMVVAADERGSSFLFKHALVRDAAYETLLVERRRRLHRAVALALEDGPAGEMALRASAIADHWERAGELARAQDRYLEAGRVALDRHAVAEAERSFRSSLRVARGPSPSAVRALAGLADSLEHQRRVADARVALRSRLRMTRRLGLPDLVGDALWSRGSLELYAGAPRRARRALADALRLARAQRLFDLEARVLMTMGSVDRELGRAASARKNLRGAARIFARLGDRRGLADTRGNLANVLSGTGALDEAAHAYRRALVAYRALGMRRNVAVTLGGLGNVLSLQGRTAHSARLFAEVLAIAREIGDLRIEDAALVNLANNRYRTGDLASAAGLYERAASVALEAGDLRVLPVALGNLAIIRHEQERLEEALQRAQEVLELHRRVGSTRLEGHTLLHIGNIQLDLGNLAAAHAHHQQALALSQAAEDQQNLCAIKIGMAAHALVRRDLGVARRLFAEARRQARKAGIPMFDLRGAIELSNLAIDDDRLERSARLLAEAARSVARIGDRRLRAQFLVARARLARHRRRFAAAARDLGSARELARATEDPRIETSAIIETGLLAIARGVDPAEPLAAARARLARVPYGPSAPIVLALAELERAAAAAERPAARLRRKRASGLGSTPRAS